jgi:tyrosine-protein phosphatase OCA1
LNLPFLSTLSLSTILWLSVDEPSDPLLSFADEHDLTIHHLGLSEDEGSNPWDPLTDKSIQTAVAYMHDEANWPLLVTCGMGRHRTGTVVGCFRRTLGWGLAACLEEYRRFTGGGRGRMVNELRIEGFVWRKESDEPAAGDLDKDKQGQSI